MYSQDSWRRDVQRNWVPCLLRDDDRFAVWSRSIGDDVQTTGKKLSLRYRVPASGFLSRQRLFVDGIRIGLNKADPKNFITKVMLNGVNYNGVNRIWENSANMNSEGDHILPVNPAQDLSRFAATDLKVTLKSTTPSALIIAYSAVSINYR